MLQSPRTIYFAGGLFDHKELAGNWLLANAIENVSHGRYAVRLPQFLSNDSSHTPLETRDADFMLMLSCDCIVANFDGPDLDSGTVVEFCFSKAMDYPAVLLRTDFRKCGDQGPGNDPWNLMCSNYPRTKSVCINGMAGLLKCKTGESGGSASKTIPDGECASCLMSYENAIAQQVIDALDAVCAMQPVYDKSEMMTIYGNAIKAIGGSLPQQMNMETLQQILSEKIARGIYS